MRRYTVEINGTSYVIDVQEVAAERYTARVNGAEFEVRLTDNEALARYLIDEFVVNFGAYRGNPLVPKLPLIRADRWWHEGDHRGGWTERIVGDGTDVTLRWTDLQTPFFVEYDTAHSATGRHEMFSLFVPGRSAEVVVNGQRPNGKPIPRDVAGRVSSTAFLAFSETWIRP